MRTIEKYKDIWGPIEEWPQGPAVLRRIVSRLSQVKPVARLHPTDLHRIDIDVQCGADIFDDVPAHKWDQFQDRWALVSEEYYRKAVDALSSIYRMEMNDNTIVQANAKLMNWQALNPQDNLGVIASHHLAPDLWVQ
jgi:hypothetical protein